MRSDLRRVLWRFAIACLVVLAPIVGADAQTGGTKPGTPARLEVCTWLADERTLLAAAREEFLGDCLDLPALATPAGMRSSAKPEAAPRAPIAREGTATRPPQRAAEVPQPQTPPASSPQTQPPKLPSAAAPAPLASSAPSVSATVRFASMAIALAIFGVSLWMARAGGRVAAALVSVIYVGSVAVTAVAFDAWRTVFNPEFVIGELKRADAVGGLVNFLATDAPGPLGPVLRRTLKDERAHFESEMGKAVHGLYDYIGGRTTDVRLRFDAAPLKTTLVRHIRAVVVADAPAGTPPSAAQQMADEAEREALPQLDEVSSATGTLASLPAGIATRLGDVRRARPYVLWVLAGGALLSLQCLVVLWIAGSPRWVGVVSAAVGLGLFAVSFGLDRIALWALTAYGEAIPIPMERESLLAVLSHFWAPVQQVAVLSFLLGATAFVVSWRWSRNTEVRE